jgi:hypothetical protein
MTSNSSTHGSELRSCRRTYPDSRVKAWPGSSTTQRSRCPRRRRSQARWRCWFSERSDRSLKRYGFDGPTGTSSYTRRSRSALVTLEKRHVERAPAHQRSPTRTSAATRTACRSGPTFRSSAIACLSRAPGTPACSRRGATPPGRSTSQLACGRARASRGGSATKPP